MSVLVLFGFVCAGGVLIWLMQAAALRLDGVPGVWAPPFRHPTETPLVRWVRKAAVQLAIFMCLILFPATIGRDSLDYHLSWLASPPWRLTLGAFGLTLALFMGYQGLNLLAGWMTLTRLDDARAMAFKLLRSALTPIPLAVVEEGLFRGVLLRQLLTELAPWGGWGVTAAVLASAAVFASLHFIRPHDRVLLPALGLFVLGVLLGMVYVATDGNCWPCVGIHAAGVWVTQSLVRFVKYRAPAWLIGTPPYPICGAVGLAAMALLGVLVVSQARITGGDGKVVRPQPTAGKVASLGNLR